MTEKTRVGVYPGSFNPPTTAHLAIAQAALAAGELDRVDLVVSHAPLGKAPVTIPSFEDRLDVLGQVAAAHAGLGLRTTSAQLLADIASDADAVVLGADKWAQVVDPSWYGESVAARDEAVSRLPLVLVAPRPPFALPRPVPGRILVLDLPDLSAVSSTAARAGGRHWMLPEAACFDRRTGAWTEPGRYRPEAGGRGSHHLPGGCV